MLAPPLPQDQVRRLFDAHSEELLRFLRSQLPLAPDDAQDILQQTFVEMQVTLSKPDPPKLSDPRAYLFRIAKNQLFRYIRRTKRAEELLEDRESVQDAEAERHDADFLAYMREDQRLLLRAMRHTRLDRQIALHLYYFVGLSASAIAFATERPEGTIRSHLREGLNDIRVTIEKLSTTSSIDAVQTTTGTLRRWWAELEEQVRSVEGE